MTEEIDFFEELEEKPEQTATVIKEGTAPAIKPIKTIKGTNWAFPLMSCQNGIIEASTCNCSVQAPEFLGDDCCYSAPTPENPQPQLCSQYKQKD